MAETVQSPARNAVVVTVNWNGMDVLPGLIDSLLPQLIEIGLKLIVVDNASTDGSDHMVEERYCPSGFVELRRMERNLGYGQAANHVLLNGQWDTAVLLNSDIVLKPGSLRKLISSLEERPEVAMAGPMLLWPDGTLQPSQRDFIFPWKLIREHLPFLRKSTARFSDHKHGTYVDWLVGASIAMRTEPFRKLGGYSEEFSFFHEETDLMYKLKREGWKIWFEPSSIMVHLESHTSRKKYGDRIDLRSMPGKLLFLRRHGNTASIPVYRILKSILIFSRYAGGLLPGKRGDDSRSFPYLRDALGTLWKNPYSADNGQSHR